MLAFARWALPSSFSLLASRASSSDGGAGSGFGGGSFSSTVLGAFFAARSQPAKSSSPLTSILGATPPARDGGAARGRPPVGVGVFTRFVPVRAGHFHTALESREVAPVGAHVGHRRTARDHRAAVRALSALTLHDVRVADGRRQVR